MLGISFTRLFVKTVLHADSLFFNGVNALRVTDYWEAINT